MGGQRHGDLRKDEIRDREKDGGGSLRGGLQAEDVSGYAFDEEGVGRGVGSPPTEGEGVHCPGLPEGIPEGEPCPTRTDEEEPFRHSVQTVS